VPQQSLTIQQAFDRARQCHQTGRRAEAESLYRQILAFEPQHLDALQMLAVLTHEAGKSSEAIQMIRRAMALYPNAASCHSNLGMMLAGQGKLDEAIACFQRSLALRADATETLNNLGTALTAKGELDAAITALKKAVALRPDFAQGYNNLGTALCTAGRVEEGIAALRRAIELRPDSSQAYFNLGKALHEKGEPDPALAALHRALELQPNYPEAMNVIAAVHQTRGQFDKAIGQYRKALLLRPDHHEILNNLGTALQEWRDVDGAIAAYRQAIAVKPDYAEAHGNLANALSQAGEFDEAMALYRRSWQLNPNPRTASGMLYLIHVLPEFTPPRILEEHITWNQTFAGPLAAEASRPHENTPDPDRRLRLGYVSPDFTMHPVGRFMLPLLRHHDHERFEIICYSDARATDGMTEQIRACTDQWHDTSRRSDAELACRIRADRIDVLVDLNMHAKGSRLLAFGRKPAPVQVTYLSYCSTTGVKTMDYRFSDPFLDPPGSDESVYSEKTLRLPDTFWCFEPSPLMPEPVSPPALEAAHVTFGCLNNFWKISPATIEMWAELLRKTPDSGLLVHAHPGRHRERFREKFRDRGVEPGRIEFVGFLAFPEYLRQYRRIDVGLDPHPYGGGTTTCETLWMGIPVVTLPGQTAVSRAGLSILSNVGLTELVAPTPAGYVEIAAGLAADRSHLMDLRSKLRRKMRAAALMDADRFARGVENAFHRVWQNWCSRSHG
jgi:predicted O-linked N-acetylglucosamine transferase (SPINDLY family)